MQNEITTQHLSKQQLLSILDDCSCLLDELGSVWYVDTFYPNGKETSFVLSMNPQRNNPQSFYFSFDGAILNGYFLTLRYAGQEHFADFTIMKAHIPTV